MNRFSKMIMIFIASGLSCSPEVTDYWASLYDSTATDNLSTADTSHSSESSSDSTVCSEDEGGVCGEESTDTWHWDGGVDASEDFCGTEDFEIYLSDIGIEFDNSNAPFLGDPSTAEVVITGFSNFSCPHCKTQEAALKELFANEKYSARAVYYFRHFPWGADPDVANWQWHRAARAAQLQNNFWAMHDLIFAVPYPGLSEEELFEAAATLGLEINAFETAYASLQTYNFLIEDQSAGKDAEITGTPTLFLNGIKVKPRSELAPAMDCILGYNDN